MRHGRLHPSQLKCLCLPDGCWAQPSGRKPTTPLLVYTGRKWVGLVSQTLAFQPPSYALPIPILTVIRRVQSCAQASDSRDFSTAMISSPFISSRACGECAEEGWEELYPRSPAYSLMSARRYESPMRGWGVRGGGEEQGDFGPALPLRLGTSTELALCWDLCAQSPSFSSSSSHTHGEDTEALAT